MEHMAAQMDSQIESAISENERLLRENEMLRTALYDLLSWFPEKPSPPEWRIEAGERGADDAVQAARDAMNGANA